MPYNISSRRRDAKRMAEARSAEPKASAAATAPRPAAPSDGRPRRSVLVIKNGRWYWTKRNEQ